MDRRKLVPVLALAAVAAVLASNAVADTGPGGMIKACVRTRAAGQPKLLGNVRVIDGPGLVFQVSPPAL